MGKIPIRIPRAWWGTLTDAETDAIFESNGRVTGEPLARLWRMVGARGKPPPSLTVICRTDEVQLWVDDYMRRYKPHE